MPRESTSGRTAEDIVESEAGGLSHRAMILLELQSALEVAAEEFAYEDEFPDLAERCRELLALAQYTYLTDDARLTTTRKCRACGGDGTYCRGDALVGCDECSGSGVE